MVGMDHPMRKKSKEPDETKRKTAQATRPLFHEKDWSIKTFAELAPMALVKLLLYLAKKYRGYELQPELVISGVRLISTENANELTMADLYILLTCLGGKLVIFPVEAQNA